MKRFYDFTSRFRYEHKVKLRKSNDPGFSIDNPVLYNDSRGDRKSHKGISKGFIKQDVHVEPEEQPDYQEFKQYQWLWEEIYRNRPFFSKDPLESFIKPAKSFADNNFSDNSEIQNNLEEANESIDNSPQKILKDIIEQRELYEEPILETGQSVPQYQDATEEIKQAMKNTFGDSFEIAQAINEVKQPDDLTNDQNLSQQGINSVVNEENVWDQFEPGLENTIDYAPSPAPEPEMEGISPAADEAMPDDFAPDLEGIIGQPDMMEEPLPDPFMMPGFFGQ